MRAPRRGRAAIALRVAVAVVAAAGLSGAGSLEAQERSIPEAEDSEERPLTRAEFEALYWARRDSARMRFTDADVAFVTGMIAHHAQALVMADLAPSHGASPSVRTLAARIINAQRDEIALMQRWLSDRGQPVPRIELDGLKVRIAVETEGPGTGGHAEGMPGVAAADAGHARMPGMLTPAQLEQLDAASGTEFDRLFLTFMIAHHEGAVTMVHDLLSVNGAAQDRAVFKLASDIQVDQRTEIARMRQMLQSLTENSERNRDEP